MELELDEVATSRRLVDPAGPVLLRVLGSGGCILGLGAGPWAQFPKSQLSPVS